MRVQTARCTFFSGWCRKSSGNKACPDHGNDEQKGREEIQERFGPSVKDVRETALYPAGGEPYQPDDDADSTQGEKRCTDNDENVAGHKVPGERCRLPNTPALGGRAPDPGSGIGISFPIQDYGRVHPQKQVAKDAGMCGGTEPAGGILLIVHSVSAREFSTAPRWSPALCTPTMSRFAGLEQPAG
jgi:hypothetical protein